MYGLHSDPRRSYGSVLLIVAGLVATVGLTTPWWTLNATSECSAGNHLFLGGGELNTGSDCGPCLECGPRPTASLSVGVVTTLLRDLRPLVTLGLLAALAAGILGLLGTRGVAFGRSQLRLVFALGGLGSLCLMLAPLFTAWLLPGDIARATGCSWPGWSPGATPCTAFWGANGTAGFEMTGYTWGPDSGWIASLVASVMALGGVLLWVPEHAAPFTRAEAVRAAAQRLQSGPTYGPPR